MLSPRAVLFLLVTVAAAQGLPSLGRLVPPFAQAATAERLHAPVAVAAAPSVQSGSRVKHVPLPFCAYPATDIARFVCPRAGAHGQPPGPFSRAGSDLRLSLLTSRPPPLAE